MKKFALALAFITMIAGVSYLVAANTNTSSVTAQACNYCE